MRKRRYRHWTATQRALVRRHYGPTAREPWPSGRIAAALGVSREDVWAAARRYGLALRTITPARPRLFARLYARGLPDGEIARRSMCVRETVLRWRRANRLPAVAGRWWRRAAAG